MAAHDNVTASLAGDSEKHSDGTACTNVAKGDLELRRLEAAVHNRWGDCSRWLRLAVMVASFALILYFPIEAFLLSALPPAIYWVVRLLPDGVVAALALLVILVGDPRARTIPIRILWILSAIVGVICIAETARGIALQDSINAIRVLVRFLALGLLLWWAAEGRGDVGDTLMRAVLVAGTVELVLVAIQIAVRLLNASSNGGVIPSFFFVNGAFDRYDRLGLFMATVIVAVLSGKLGRLRLALLVGCAVALYLSTSRQAELALAVGCALIALWPAAGLPRRVIASVVGIAAVLFVIATPTGIVAPASASATTVDPLDVVPTAAPGSSVAPVALPVGRKDLGRLTIDPNKNFRLYLNLDLAPWAAAQEPLLGFGPRQQVAAEPDPRLAEHVAAAGSTWEWARNFTNDSNYASLILQFGVIAPAIFLGFLLLTILQVARAGWRSEGGPELFAVAYAAGVLVAAGFGPSFEIRAESLVLWLSLMAVRAAAARAKPVRVARRGSEATAVAQ